MKIFTAAGGDAHAAFVHRGRQIRPKMKAPCGSFKVFYFIWPVPVQFMLNTFFTLHLKETLYEILMSSLGPLSGVSHTHGLFKISPEKAHDKFL